MGLAKGAKSLKISASLGLTIKPGGGVAVRALRSVGLRSVTPRYAYATDKPDIEYVKCTVYVIERVTCYRVVTSI